jgi:hypothetical protein
MPQRRRTEDPYAPPPMHHDRSGAVVRVAILAALIGASAWGYMTYADQSEQTALAPETQQELQVADAGYPTPTEALPPVETESAPQTPSPAAPAAAPAPRRSAPATPPPAPAPAPSTTPAPPTAPTPIPPVDLPPPG